MLSKKLRLIILSNLMILGLILIGMYNLYIYNSVINLLFFIFSLGYFIIINWFKRNKTITNNSLNKEIFIISHQGAYLFSVSEFMEYSSKSIEKSLLMFLVSLLIFSIIIFLIGFSFNKNSTK